jgi:hypothetical protein
MLSNIQESRRGLVLLVLWRAWHLRCDVVHGKGESSIIGSVTFLKNYLNCLKGVSILQDPGGTKRKAPSTKQDFRTAECSLQQQPTLANQKSKHWTKPDAGWIKINVDASFLESSNNAWVGFVARNNMGAVIVAGARQIQNCFNIEEAEARACTVGLQSVPEGGQYSVALESDNASVVATIKNQSEYRGRL